MIAGWAPPTDPSRYLRYEAPDGSTWIWDQPRNENGTFMADDPTTPEQESAMRWLPEVTP